MASTASAPVTPSTPSLLHGEVERDLGGTVRELLTDRAGWTDVLARTESAERYDEALWQTMSKELGLAGLLVPEERGGEGASAREVAVVLTGLGQSVAPVPYLASAVIATGALLACDGAVVDDALRDLVAGQVGTLAVPATTAPGVPYAAIVAAVGSGAHGGVRISGRVRNVLAGDRADVCVVPAAMEGRSCLVLVDARGGGVHSEPVTSLDLTRPVADIEFDAAAGTILATGERAEEAVGQALRLGAALLASEQVGLAEKCLETTLEHLRTRHQFGRPIGSFQALKHRVAELWAQINGAQTAALYGAACEPSDLPVAAALAQSYCSEVAVHAAEECVQLHGGVGFTWEHPAHLYLKRAMASQLLLGTPDRHRQTLAALANLPPA